MLAYQIEVSKQIVGDYSLTEVALAARSCFRCGSELRWLALEWVEAGELPDRRVGRGALFSSSGTAHFDLPGPPVNRGWKNLHILILALRVVFIEIKIRQPLHFILTIRSLVRCRISAGPFIDIFL